MELTQSKAERARRGDEAEEDGENYDERGRDAAQLVVSVRSSGSVRFGTDSHV